MNLFIMIFFKKVKTYMQISDKIESNFLYILNLISQNEVLAF